MRLNRKTFRLGLFDSDTGLTIPADRVEEMRTRAGDRMILAYGRAKRGPLVQIIFPYDQTPRGDTMGMSVHFFTDSLGPPARPGDDTLASMATRAGMPRSEMVKLLSSRAPASEGKTDG